MSGVGWWRIAESVLSDQVDGRAWHTADGLCSLSCGKGTSGSSCTLGRGVEKAAVPALPQVAVATCSCRVVGPACFAAGGLAYSAVYGHGGLLGPRNWAVRGKCALGRRVEGWGPLQRICLCVRWVSWETRTCHCQLAILLLQVVVGQTLLKPELVQEHVLPEVLGHL